MTYQIDEEALLRKIDGSGLDAETKSVFRNTIRELCAYTRNHLERIEKKILSPADPQAVGEIVVALTPRRSRRDKPFFGLTEIDGGSDGVLFLDAEYERVREIVGDLDAEKVYEGVCRLADREVPFRYRLRFDGRYLEAQDLLFRLASLYRMENAVLWSPFLRKAVGVQPVDGLPEGVEKDQIDYRFEQNRLPVLEGRSLLWNLQTSVAEARKADGRVPYGRDIKYIFHFERSKSGGWRFPAPRNNQTVVYGVSFSDEGVDLTLDHELESFWIVEPGTVDPDAGEILRLKQEHRLHSNFVGRDALSVRRVLSRGDMEFAIRPFRDAGGVRCELAGRLERVCTRYSAKYRSGRNHSLWYPQRQKAAARLRFSADEPPPFYDDYINYVLLYLEYYYPEIEWAGGW